MKKILLIEDRVTRQRLSCIGASIDLVSYEDIVDNTIEDKYERFLKDLEDGKFIADEYIAIMAHQSAFGDKNQQILSQIESICKESDIPLVLFSGGISVSHYMREGEFERLLVNTKLFYSSNLRLFLDHYKATEEVELMILNYGRSWRLNILLNVLEKVNLFVEKNSQTDIVYGEFCNDVENHLLEKITNKGDIKEIERENGWTTIDEIKEYVKSINNLAKDRIIHER